MAGVRLVGQQYPRIVYRLSVIGELDTQCPTQRFQCLLVYLIKRCGLIAVDIQHREKRTVGSDYGNHQLALGGSAACDMAWKRLYIGDQQSLFGACSSSTHAVFEGDPKTSVLALIRSNDQLIPRNRTIKTSPVKVLKRVMQLAAHCCHRSDPVVLTLKNGFEPTYRLIIVALFPGIGFC